MDGDENPWLVSLKQRVGPNADAAQIADVVVPALREISAVLCPVIGTRGFGALYSRCIYLTGLDHPWLADIRDPVRESGDFNALGRALAQQSSAQSIAGSAALLQKLDELLNSLIGSSLTQQLLGSAWAHSLRGHRAKETLP
jgi:hypothetical protein